MILKKIVVIGLDGVPYRLLKDLATRGVMPNIESLMDTGIFKKMSSTVPEISSVAWSSIYTGKNPGEHGIYGFTDTIPGTYSVSYHSSTKLRVKPFWQDNEATYALINLPATYPASKVNGLLVSGFVAPDLEKAVYPSSYLDKLRELKYKIDIDAEQARKSNRLLFKKLFETLESRIRTYRFFWDRVNWDVFMFVVTGTDRLGHYLWDAYEDESHEYHEKFLEFFREIDKVIGEIRERHSGPVMLLSDHGMESAAHNVYLNAFLAEHGFLKRGNNPNKGLNNIEKGTKAFAMDPGRIYLNKKDRYLEGSVEQQDEEEVVNNLIQAVNQLKRDNKPVIKNIHRKGEVYHGKHTDKAPDLVLEASSGYKLKATLLKEQVFEESELSGKHTRDDAFLLVNGNISRQEIPHPLYVEDFLSMLQKLREKE